MEKNSNEKLIDFAIDEANNDRVLVVISVDRNFSSSIEISSNANRFNTEKILNLAIKAFNHEIGKEIIIRDA